MITELDFIITDLAMDNKPISVFVFYTWSKYCCSANKLSNLCTSLLLTLIISKIFIQNSGDQGSQV